MGSISDHKPSLVITINDILDQLMAENKQLFTSLNQLIKHLIEIYFKYKTIIDSEDITRWDQLRQQVMDNICDYKSRDVNQVDNGCDARQKGPSNEQRVTRRRGRPLKEVVNQLDTKDINDCKTQYKVPKKPKRKYKKGSKRQSLPPKSVRCEHEDCQYRCRTVSALASHQRTHEKPDREAYRRQRQEYRRCYDFATKVYICPESDCPTKFYKTYYSFRRHMVGVHSSKTVPCDHKECPKLFKTRYLMRGHYKKIHGTDKPYRCPYDDCTRRYCNQGDLDRHLVVHKTDRPFGCDFVGCVKTFKSYLILQSHKRIHNPKPWAKCRVDGCVQMFHNYSQLAKHRAIEHNIAVRKYRYKRRYNARCEWPGCDYVTIGPSMLRLHQSIHTGQRDYVCDWPECGKRFGRPNNLRDHKNIHNNLKPYVCHWPGCSYRCADSSNSSKHYKQVHLK